MVEVDEDRKNSVSEVWVLGEHEGVQRELSTQQDHAEGVGKRATLFLLSDLERTVAVFQL